MPWPRAAREPLPFFLTRTTPLLSSQRYQDAVAVLEEAAETHRQDPWPVIQIGRIYLAQHRWLLAEDAFNRALARDLQNPIALAGLAETLLNQGRLTEALRQWQQASVIDPDLPGVFTGVGRTYLLLFEFEAAREAFETQLARQPDGEAQWYLAALIAPANLAEAATLLEAIPGQASPVLLARRDYLLAALAPFTAATPQFEVAKATGIALAQAEMWPLAVHALKIAREQSPVKDAETLAFLGHVLAQSGHPAIEILEEAHQADPASPLPLYFQGLYLRRQGALRAAEERFKQAIELDPDNAAMYVEVAQTKAAQGNLSLAEAWYLAALKVAGDTAEFERLLVRFYADYGYRLAEAGIPRAEAMVKKEPDDAEMYDLLGWMQFRGGLPGAGEEALRRAVELDPGLVSGHYHLGRWFESNGWPLEAIAQYRQVIDLDTSNLFRDRALKDLQRLQ